jgi:Ca2+-binding RTX toxin-like protein
MIFAVIFGLLRGNAEAALRLRGESGMPVQTVDTDSLEFSDPNQQWIVKAGVVISTTAVNANAVTIARSDGQLINHGDISATGGGTGGHAVEVDFFGQHASILNSAQGTMTGSTGIVFQSSGTHLSNQGSIIGLAKHGIEYTFSAGASEIHNSGYIYGKTSAVFAEALDTITIVNSGVIEAGGDALAIGLGTSTGRIVNTGTIIGGGHAIISTLFRSLYVENTGTIIGDVLLKGFDPEKVINNGLIRGDVTFGNSADIFRGRDGVVDGSVFAGLGNDSLKGGAADDEFFGERGQDELFGRGGDDLLSGGDLGDKLKGGGGADTFLYDKAADSKGGVSADTRLDTILDFRSSQGDTIDLARIDLKGDQKLEFIGSAAFSGKKGEVRYEIKGDNAFVQLDIAGGKRPDVEIKLKGVSTLHADDFDL